MRVVGDVRLGRMIEIAEETGLSLDEIAAVMARADQRTFAALSDNPSLLPKYIQSRVRP